MTKRKLKGKFLLFKGKYWQNAHKQRSFVLSFLKMLFLLSDPQLINNNQLCHHNNVYLAWILASLPKFRFSVYNKESQLRRYSNDYYQLSIFTQSIYKILVIPSRINSFVLLILKDAFTQPLCHRQDETKV